MNEQPEALRLAEFCDFNVLYQPAAAELRRLHEENERLRGIVPEVLEQLNDELCEENEELLEALKLARSICNILIGHPENKHGKLIDAAIKKAEGKE
jgi:hypothetical protein